MDVVNRSCSRVGRWVPHQDKLLYSGLSSLILWVFGNGVALIIDPRLEQSRTFTIISLLFMFVPIFLLISALAKKMLAPSH